MNTRSRLRSLVRALLVLLAFAVVLAVGRPASGSARLVTACPSPNPATLYVNASVSGGTGDGSSWANAYASLAAALTTASDCPNVTQIWVAAGTYKPTSGADRTATFGLRNNLAIYGGFTSGQTLLSQRNWRTNVTTLSGDIGTANSSSDNSYHVVTGSGTNSTAILDGFTVTGGNADLDNYLNPNPIGGGMYNDGGSPALSNLTISGNYAVYGGGMYNKNSSPTLTNVTVSGNYALDYGGGMYNYGNSSPTLTGVTFSGNYARVYGGGIASNSDSYPTIRNSIFWGNSSEIADLYNSSTTVVYSIVQGLSTGTGNLNLDPLFVAPITASAPTTTGNLRLQANSPAINVGSNDVTTPSLPATDLDDNPRIVFTTVDMGAYEAQIKASPSPTPAANAAGWNNTDVTVTWNWSNAGGAIPASADCPATTTSSGEGTLTLSATCKDSNGYTGYASVTVKVDKTAPTASPTGSGTPGSNGWYTSDVTVTWNWSDNAGGSGLNTATCPTSTTTSGEGAAVSVNAACYDLAGNPGAASYTVKVDKTAPTITITSPADGAVYPQGAPLTASFSCADPGGSGLASCVGTVANGSSISTAVVGAYSFTVTATDTAGNTASRTVRYVVGYTVTSVSPLVGPPGVNSLYSPSIGTTATPIRWKLTNAAGTAITAAGTVTGVSYKANPGCGTFPTDPTGATAASVTSANPRYDSVQRAWVYNWTLPGRGCYTLFITLNNGQVVPLFYRIY
ncbi:MAG: choice-of-anchor Q domain-containing protein [Anaerolineae bacterium]